MTNNVLAANALASDPRVAQAKRLLLEAVNSHKKVLTGVKLSNPLLKQSYEALLAEFAESRGAKLWHPYLGSGIGNGCLVELLDGSVKYDFITGIGVHYLGHSHPDIISASIDAAISNTVMQGNLQQNGDSVELSLMLTQSAHMEHCFLTTSGAMANENALKIAFQKRFPASRILAFEKGFAGRSLVLSQITDKPAFREGLPATVIVDYLPFYDCLKPEESTKRSVSMLKQYLARHPKEYAVMIFELVQGESGFYPGTHDFFASLMHVLKEHHVSIFIDEVQSFARTQSLFAFQHFGLEEFAEIVTIGKLSQVCATLFNKEHCPRAGLLSQTFTGSTVAIRAAKVILQQLISGDYYGPNGRIAKIHKHFVSNLQDIAKRHPGLLQGPFGIGAMIAFTPFEGKTARTIQFVHDLFDAGVISFIAGANPTRVRFLVPAGAVNADDINQVTKIIEETLLK